MTQRHNNGLFGGISQQRPSKHTKAYARWNCGFTPHASVHSFAILLGDKECKPTIFQLENEEKENP